MTETQDVLDTRRPRRRRTPVILLGTLPALIATTILLTEGRLSPADATAATPQRTSAAAVVENRPSITPGVIAPSSIVDRTSDVHTVTVTFPKPVVKAPAKTTTSTTHKTTTRTSTTTKKSSSGSTSVNYKTYCKNPGKSVSAGGSAKSLLTAVNAERAKIGARPLSWSSSLASAAQKWSNTMLSNDLATSTLIDGLAHNPNRPGAENVAVVYNSAGYSASSAISRMHSNLMHSYGHCLNIMNPSYSHMGAGVAASSDGSTWYATENFN